MLKVDLDVYVNIPKLFHLLTKDKELQRNEYLLMGRCLRCGVNSPERIRKQNLEDLKERLKKFVAKQPKFQIPSYFFNGEMYPTYLQGSAYVMSRKSAECIFQKALETPYFPIEDVYITGFVAQQCSIERQHSPHFTGKNKVDFKYDTHFAYHLNCGSKDVHQNERDIKYCHNGILTFK